MTISGNYADHGGGIYCSNRAGVNLMNTILWNDLPQEVYLDGLGFWPGSTITIAYSDVQGGESGIVTNNNSMLNWLDGNIDSNPLFVGPENGDFHLQLGSPSGDW